MGLWGKLKRWRAERNAEREAIRRSQQDLLRAGEGSDAARDVTEQNRLAGSRNAGIASGFDGDISDL
jgi:hypothetical protein